MPSDIPPPLVIALGQACEHLRAIVKAERPEHKPQTRAELTAAAQNLATAIEDARVWLRDEASPRLYVEDRDA